jgi:hypothetical protein
MNTHTVDSNCPLHIEIDLHISIQDFESEFKADMKLNIDLVSSNDFILLNG